MAQVVSGNQVKLDNGQIISANQGGWYDGQQFWGGTLSAPGVINSLSDQIGAGQAVSPEVNRQSDVAQGLAPGSIQNYLKNQTVKLANTPAPYLTSRNGVQSYTNGLQNSAMGAFSATSAPQVQNISEITNELKNLLPVEAPTAPNMMDTYNKLTADGTVTDLEKSIIDLKAQKADAIAQLDVNRTAERGKPVAQNVVEGRISEQTRMAQEKVDFIDRQITTAADELTMRYKSIETIMKYTQIDFENAKSVYDTKFEQAMTLMTQARGIQQDQLTAQQRAIDNARANLQIFANAITSGNMSLNNLPAESVAALNGMELSAGLPMGFIQSLQMSSKDSILHINDSTGEVLMSDGARGFKTVHVMTGTESAGGSDYTDKQWRSEVSSAIAIIDKVDKGFQTINGKLVPIEKTDKFGYTITSMGDSRLSAQEADYAYNQILKSVGNDQELADKLFNEAKKGFTSWNP